MRLQRALRRVFAFGVAVCVAATAAGTPAAGLRPDEQVKPGSGDQFDEIFRRGGPFEKTLKTVSARFTETTSSTLLKAPLVSHGTLVGRRPSQVRLDYAGADARTVIVNGNTLAIDWPSRHMKETRDISGTMRRAQRFFTATTPAELRRHFDIATADAQDRPGTWRVTFTPRRRQMREGVERVHLWLERTSLTLTAMKLDYPGGDTRLMEFADVRVNPPVEAGAFATAAPASRR